MADETANESVPVDPREVALYSIHLPAKGPGSASRELTLPSGAKKRMNRDQDDKEAEDYPHVRARITHAQAADLAANGYQLRLIKETEAAAPAETDMRARAASAKPAGRKG
jgi:hypothetical protein